MKKITCPNCGSDQISANKKGFSGKKAVVGGLLTGGVGLLAGTVGSNKVIITCLACGYEFKPGEGKLVDVQETKMSTVSQDNAAIPKLDDVDKRILEFCQQGAKLQAVKYCKEERGWDLITSKNYVDKFAAQHGIGNVPGKAGGCFVATACYGNYDAPEVLVLRKFRDEKLLKSFSGKVFVKIYYSISPSLAALISKSDRLKKSIRKCFLNPIVSRLQSKKR